MSVIHKHHDYPDNKSDRRYLTAVASLGASVGGSLGMAGPLTYGTSLAIGTGTILAGGALMYGMTQMMKPPSMPDMGGQQAYQDIQAPTYEQAEDTAREDQLELARRKAALTTLTTPQGLLSTEPVTTKTLLGA